MTQSGKTFIYSEKKRRVDKVGLVFSSQSKFFQHFLATSQSVNDFSLSGLKERNITIIQAYTPTTASEKDETQEFYICNRHLKR